MMRTLKKVVFAVLLASMSQWSMAGEELETVEAALTRVSRVQEFDGVVEAINQSTVSSRASGVIKEIYFDVNDYVSKGEVLMRMDDAQQQASLKKALAAMENAQAENRKTAAEYKRAGELFGKKLISKADMEKVEAARRSARANVKSAQASLDQASEQLDYTIIIAPFSGIVGERYVEVGEAVQPGKALIAGISLENLRVAVDVPQSLVEKIREGGSATISYGKRYVDKVSSSRLTIFPYANPVNHTFRIRVYMEHDEADLYPGMFVKVGFVVGTKQRLLVPQQSVVHRGDVTGAYVIGENNTIRLRMLRIGHKHEDGRIEVLSGLEDGEQVAVDPIRAGVRMKESLQKGGES